MRTTADVVIIGGGIQGASIAWHLARRGARDVVLLEKETLASGCSGRTGGVIRQHYSTPIVTETRRNGNPVGKPTSGGQTTPAPGATDRTW